MLRLSAAVLRTPLRMARVILSSDPNDVAYVADRDRGSGPSGHLSNQMCGAGSYASARIWHDIAIEYRSLRRAGSTV